MYAYPFSQFAVLAPLTVIKQCLIQVLALLPPGSLGVVQRIGGGFNVRFVAGCRLLVNAPVDDQFAGGVGRNLFVHVLSEYERQIGGGRVGRGAAYRGRSE